jgi:hypothetical protein
MKSRLARVGRERVTNYGDAQLVTDTGRETLFTLHKNDGGPLLVTVQCVEISIPVGSIGLADFRPMVHLEWGHGASSVGADFDCTFRQRIPLACSTVEASAFIGAFPLAGGAGPVAVPAGSIAKFRSFVSEGTDDLPMAPTQWVTQFNAATGVLATAQARLMSLRAFAKDSAVTKVPYFLLFDSAAAPAPGAVPVDGMPLTVAGPITAALGVSGPSPGFLPQGQSRAYVNGIAWGISSTPYTFTADTDGLTAFVSAELLS